MMRNLFARVLMACLLLAIASGEANARLFYMDKDVMCFSARHHVRPGTEECRPVDEGDWT